MNNYSNYYSQRRAPQTATMMQPDITKPTQQGLDHLASIQHGFGAQPGQPFNQQQWQQGIQQFKEGGVASPGSPPRYVGIQNMMRPVQQPHRQRRQGWVTINGQKYGVNQKLPWEGTGDYEPVYGQRPGTGFATKPGPGPPAMPGRPGTGPVTKPGPGFTPVEVNPGMYGNRPVYRKSAGGGMGNIQQLLQSDDPNAMNQLIQQLLMQQLGVPGVGGIFGKPAAIRGPVGEVGGGQRMPYETTGPRSLPGYSYFG